MSQFYLRTISGEKVKFIISVSKKVSKQAVVRNQIKRRIRPILKKFTTKLKPATYLIVAQSGAETVKGQNLESQLAELLKKSYNGSTSSPQVV